MKARLIALLQAIRPSYGAPGSRDCDVTAQRNRIDEAIAILELPGSFADTLDGTKWRRLLAFRDVSAERNRQDEQWGGPVHDDEHVESEWLDYISHQVTKAYSGATREDVRSRLVKIAALAVAGVESIDRKGAAS